jgi:hypothetical protein
MSALPNPFALLTNQQFAALFVQAAGPVFNQAALVSVGLQAMMAGQMTASALNPQVATFQSLYTSLQPYFDELVARAGAGT